MSQDLSYILPYRSRPGDGNEEELDRYVRWLSRRVQLIVVDGSDPDRVRAHREQWGSIATGCEKPGGVQTMPCPMRMSDA